MQIYLIIGGIIAVLVIVILSLIIALQSRNRRIKELKNDKVVFVSISIDSTEEPWKKKMEEKQMHGHQLWNPENTLGQALNVKGIPFFAIYDPEGCLYMHGAPRPSQGPGLVKLLEGLK